MTKVGVNSVKSAGIGDGDVTVVAPSHSFANLDLLIFGRVPDIEDSESYEKAIHPYY